MFFFLSFFFLLKIALLYFLFIVTVCGYVHELLSWCFCEAFPIAGECGCLYQRKDKALHTNGPKKRLIYLKKKKFADVYFR